MPAIDVQTIPESAGFYIGRGLTSPMVRESADFANATGALLLSHLLARGLGTQAREVPWDYAFGLDIDRRRNQDIDAEAAEEIRANIKALLPSIDPRIAISEVLVVTDAAQRNLTRVQVHWYLRNSRGAGDAAIAGPFSVDVLV